MSGYHGGTRITLKVVLTQTQSQAPSLNTCSIVKVTAQRERAPKPVHDPITTNLVTEAFRDNREWKNFRMR